MIALRARQQSMVTAIHAALEKSASTLAVAPTGAGKTVILSAVASEYAERGEAVLVLQHRDELVAQNRATLAAMAPQVTTGAIWHAGRAWGQVTYAMVPTLTRARHLVAMPPVGLVIVDEAHHATARSYRRILDHARSLRDDVRVLGVTATPQRGDRAALGDVFCGVADQITVGELVGSGHLVEPRAWVLDVGVTEQLARVGRTSGGRGEYDLDQAAAVLRPVTGRVVDEWAARSADRQTVVFCGTVAHATECRDVWRERGYTAEVVTGETPTAERREIFASLERGEVQVLSNVAVATEGWDCPPVSCVVLMRPSSYQSTMIQMIGRGLRTLDPRKYPNRPPKSDCLILDFGRSLETHGGIEQIVDLRPHCEPTEPGAAPRKTCPECRAEIPIRGRECPLCGYQWEPELTEAVELAEFRMRELDLLIRRSPYRWWQYSDRVRVVSAIEAWAVVLRRSGAWHAVVGGGGDVEHVASGLEGQCVAAAEDWMRANAKRSIGGRGNLWLDQPPTPKQLEHLARWSTVPEVSTRYEASCAMTLRFNRRRIAAALGALG